ncbi:MAG TPA: IS630 family transposase [Candidatus Acidoferrales bacterium]|nr:IS630 family transposase [Candidatus Acidoferrales bacterium]
MPRDPVGRRSFPPEERHEVLGLACHPQTELAAARTHWAVRPLAEAAYRWGYLRGRITKSTVSRWLNEAVLKPHRVRRWLHSPDPEFRRKVRRVVRLYLHPPRGTPVICVDEKTQVQLLERLHPGRPLAPGRPQRIEVDYRRHGTLAVLAGLELRTNHVTLKVRRRRRHQEFLEFLQALRTRWPKGKLIVVLDNLSIHTTPEVQAWLKAQAGKVHLEFLPLHASWLNQIELWFSILERQAPRRARDASYRQRANRIYRFAVHWNRIARPFRWTFKGYPLCQ